MDGKLGRMGDRVSDAGSDPILDTMSVRRRANRGDRVQRQET